MPSIVTATWWRRRPTTSGVSGRNHRSRLTPATSSHDERHRGERGGRRHRNQPRQAHVAHDRPVDVVPAPAAAADADDRRGDHLRRGDRAADERGAEDHAGGRPAAGETVDRADAVDPPPDGLHDPPAAEGGPDGQRQGAGELDPRRRGQLRDPAVGEQQRGHHADRLLRVVGAVAEGEGRRRHPLPGPHRVVPAPRRAAARSSAARGPRPAPRRRRAPARWRAR